MIILPHASAKIKQKGLRVWNFALLLVVFKWHHGSEGVKVVASFLCLEQEPDLRALELIGIRGYPSLTLNALHAYGPSLLRRTHTHTHLHLGLYFWSFHCSDGWLFLRWTNGIEGRTRQAQLGEDNIKRQLMWLWIWDKFTTTPVQLYGLLMSFETENKKWILPYIKQKSCEP